MRTSKKVLLYAMISISVHKILEFFLLYFVGREFSPVSTICWYTFWGYELRLLAGLKRVELSSPYANVNVKRDSIIENTPEPDAAE